MLRRIICYTCSDVSEKPAVSTFSVQDLAVFGIKLQAVVKGESGMGLWINNA